MHLTRSLVACLAVPAIAAASLLAPTAALAQNPPDIVTEPTIPDTIIAGRTVSCDGAVFSGNEQGTVTYAWRKSGVGQVGSEQTYTPTREDIGWDLSCSATATNPFGSIEGTSNRVSVEDGRPDSETSPRLTGKTAPGATVSCSTGTWTGENNSYTFEWVLNDKPIRGATKRRLLLLDRFIDKPLACRVTATNASGSASMTSNQISPFAPPILAPLAKVQPKLPKLKLALKQGITNTLNCNATCASQSHAFILASDAARLGIRGKNIGGAIVVGTGTAKRTFKGKLVIRTKFTASARRGLAKAGSKQRIDLLFETAGGTKYSHKKYHVAVSKSIRLRR